MSETDKKLKHLLLEQLKKSRPLSDKIIKDLANPRYTSGKLMKFGDIPLHVLEMKPKNSDAVELRMCPKSVDIPGIQITPTAIFYPKVDSDIRSTQLVLVLLCSDEIDEFCRKYWYAGGNEDATMVIKRPE